MRRSKLQKRIMLELWSCDPAAIIKLPCRVYSLTCLSNRLGALLSVVYESVKLLVDQGFLKWVQLDEDDVNKGLYDRILILTDEGNREAEEYANEIFDMMPSSVVFRDFTNKFWAYRGSKK